MHMARNDLKQQRFGCANRDLYYYDKSVVRNDLKQRRVELNTCKQEKCK